MSGNETCRKCGCLLTEGAKFCRVCGTEVVAQPEEGRGNSGAGAAGLAAGIMGLLVLGLAAQEIVGVLAVRLFSCLLEMLGLILGIAGLRAANRSGPRRRGRGLAIGAICVSWLGIAILVLLWEPWMLPLNGRMEAAHRSEFQCAMNVKQLSMAVEVYKADWDERMPLAGNWSDALETYLEKPEVFVCPEAREARSGYAYNLGVAGINTAGIDLPSQARVVVIFESGLGWNGAGGVEALVATPRHRGFDEFGMLDGHIETLARGQAESGLIWQPTLREVPAPGR